MIVLKLLIVMVMLPSLGVRVSAQDHGRTLTETDKKNWIICIKKVKMKPPCCGACKLMTQEDAKAVWNHVSGNSKGGAQDKNLKVWLTYKNRLLEEFKNLSPERYRDLYGEK